MILSKDQIAVPLTVPKSAIKTYLQNYVNATLNSGRLFLFAGDQKIEHLNKDFFGENIPAEVAHPEHLFNIASQARIGVFATHLGLAARYGSQYKNIRYLIKLNGKTDLVPTSDHDPLSTQLHSVDDVIQFRQDSGLDIVAVGCTVYLGSEFESVMLEQAAQMVLHAHQHGLLTVIWMYPRGKSVSCERSKEIVAGAAGVANALGADFVKVNAPEGCDEIECGEALKSVVIAAGNTKVICSGGSKVDNKAFAKTVYYQMVTGGVGGIAVGRNIYQNTLATAIKVCDALAAIVIDDVSIEHVLKKLE